MVSPPVLGSPDDEDRIASAATFGFVVDLVAVEVDAKTGAIRIDKYASVHDVGTQLNPSIVEGQVHGGFVHGLGAALFEELAYDEPAISCPAPSPIISVRRRSRFRRSRSATSRPRRP